MRGTTLLASLLAVATGALASALPAGDPDLFWHLASGDWMIAHGRLLDHDVFSFTRVGTPYASGQWLGQVVLAAAFGGAGWAGIAVLRGLLVACGTFFLARATLRLQPHPGWAAIALAAAILVSKITWGDRPQLFTLALFPLLLDLLLAARLEGRTRRLVLVPIVVLAWTNLHGAFAAGVGLVAIFAAEAALAQLMRWRPDVPPPARPFALALAGSALATLANPAASGAVAWAASYAASAGAAIAEERPPDVLSGPGLLFCALLLAVFASALVCGRDGVAVRVGAPLLVPALIVPFSLLGLAVQRQMPLACVVLAPFVAALAPAALGRAVASSPSFPRGLAACLVGAAVVAGGAAAAAAAPRAPDLAAYPVAALPALGRVSGNLLNEYDWGGFLIREAPGHPTFIDGRGALLFAPAVLADFQRATQVRPGYRDVLARHDIRLALLKPGRPLVEVLRDDGWRVLAEDETFVLLQR